MKASANLNSLQLPVIVRYALLFVAVVFFAFFTVNQGLFGALTVLPVIAVVSVPWHLRLSFLLPTVCFQSALIVPLAPGPLYMWLGACLLGWTGVAIALLFRKLPESLGFSLRSNRLLFLGLLVYCINLAITLKVRGFGLNILGSAGAMGGRFPLEQLLCAILPLAYICVETNERELSLLYRVQLVLTGTFILSELAITWAPGQAQYLFYFLVPSSDMVNFAQAEFVSFARYQSFKLAAPAMLFLVLISNPRERLTNIHALYLWPGCIALSALSLLSGHREALILPLFIVAVYLAVLRFFKTTTVLFLVVFALVSYAVLFVAVDSLPLAVQRSVSFVPGLHVSEVAAVDASSTAVLRWELTKMGWEMVPDNFWLGRGFLMNPTPTQLEKTNMLAQHIWRGHFYNGFIGLLVHTGFVGTVSALCVYLGGLLLALRVIRRLRRSGFATTFERVAAMLASYCIAKPIYYLLVNGNSMVALQEFVLPIGLLLACERLLQKRDAAAVAVAEAAN